ncbi:Vitamin K epoxide reductase family protein [Rubripirellula lacrimiformis]|uniref:Vitamin K epoxide reductase family protein n=1 Tax=Rubripirellula lacrimiformis TaxID=1930273 RepID=A0A517N4A2_9BACT|nr:vitamin K epoxide reductase family protein [Rubripirellula lacrimiformis]QDT01963.1 Vitamin K epoxide reductase family protein [Rubripirellula lacrimiformis]
MSSVDMRHPFHDGFFARPNTNRTSRVNASRAESSSLPPAVWWTMFVASGIALATSTYLAWSSLTSSPVAGCSGGSLFDCSHVLHTRWSSVLSVPVSIPAIATHLTLITLLLIRPVSGSRHPAGQDSKGHHPASLYRRLRMTGIGLASLAAGAAAIWFIGLQIFVIQHLCPYCLVAHTAGLTLAAVFLWQHPVSRQAMTGIGSAAVVSLAVLATLQIRADEPQTFEVIQYPQSSAVQGSTSTVTDADNDDATLFQPPASAQLQTSLDNMNQRWNPQQVIRLSSVFMNPSSILVSEVQVDSPSEKSSVVILGGVKLATDSWPLVGDPNAELVVVEMFDYTCPHCQRTHASLKGAEQKYGDRLAVITLPVPLDGKCNPTVRSTNPAHADACDLAKLSIAVWATDREQFGEFHHYLFDSKPGYAQALGKAKTMVDSQKLDAVLRGPLPSDYVQRHVQLYQKAGSGQIPKLLFPRTTAVGAVESTDAMIRLIEQNLVR